MQEQRGGAAGQGGAVSAWAESLVGIYRQLLLSCPQKLYGVSSFPKPLKNFPYDRTPYWAFILAALIP
jgi:hypothetical protein